MNVLDLTDGQAILVDVALLAVLGVSVGYAGHRLPASWLDRDRGPLRLLAVERAGTWYARRLRIKRWKDRLPEAGAVFAGGVTKRRLDGRTRADLLAFAAETRRAELVHGTLIVAAAVFVVVSPWLPAAIMIAYSLAANLPCLLVQRYNRARVTAILGLGVSPP